MVVHTCKPPLWKLREEGDDLELTRPAEVHIDTVTQNQRGVMVNGRTLARKMVRP